MSFYVLLSVFGLFAGITTVLFGFGGGFVVVPLLYRMVLMANGAQSMAGRSAMQIAVATSTCVMVFGAALATRRHQRAGTIDWSQVQPLLLPIALGAAIGAIAANASQGEWLRWAFVAYLALTILDSLFRPGFIARRTALARAPSGFATASSGLAIGAVAALLGVGGSVMTVPLMRRRGVAMAQATAMANPLSLPVALAGAATYLALGWQAPSSLGGGYIGHVDLRALAVLVVGSWLGIRLAAPLIGRIPDAVHAKVYLGLLVAVLLAMVLR